MHVHVSPPSRERRSITVTREPSTSRSRRHALTASVPGSTPAATSRASRDAASFRVLGPSPSFSGPERVVHFAVQWYLVQVGRLAVDDRERQCVLLLEVAAVAGP